MDACEWHAGLVELFRLLRQACEEDALQRRECDRRYKKLTLRHAAMVWSPEEQGVR